MPQIGEQKQRIEDIQSAKYITGALRDISAIELKGLRDRFETNKAFFEEIRDLFQLMWRITQAAGVEPRAPTKKDEKLFVAYTTNKHFYGALNHNVMRKYMKATDTKDCCLVIGDTGKEIWMEHAKKRRELSFLSFKNDMPNEKETVDLMAHVGAYGQVYVFYPGFVSVFDQNVEVLDITFKPSKETLQKNTTALEDAPQYLLEPDVVEMAAFFDTQVRYVLFERMLLETQLSQVAARLVKMDMADQNANGLIDVERRELRRAFASFSSRRMLETLVGYLQWHTQKPQHIAQ